MEENLKLRAEPLKINPGTCLQTVLWIWILILFADFWVKITIILGDLAKKFYFPVQKYFFFTV
jgi:hypothetical protein